MEGDVVGDLEGRRGMIEGMDEGVAGIKIRALPLSEMFGYATDLRSAIKVEHLTRWSSMSTQKCRKTLPKQSLQSVVTNKNVITFKNSKTFLKINMSKYCADANSWRVVINNVRGESY